MRTTYKNFLLKSINDSLFTSTAFFFFSFFFFIFVIFFSPCEQFPNVVPSLECGKKIESNILSQNYFPLNQQLDNAHLFSLARTPHPLPLIPYLIISTSANALHDLREDRDKIGAASVRFVQSIWIERFCEKVKESKMKQTSGKKLHKGQSVFDRKGY